MVAPAELSNEKKEEIMKQALNEAILNRATPQAMIYMLVADEPESEAFRYAISLRHGVTPEQVKQLGRAMGESLGLLKPDNNEIQDPDKD